MQLSLQQYTLLFVHWEDGLWNGKRHDLLIQQEESTPEFQPYDLEPHFIWSFKQCK